MVLSMAQMGNDGTVWVIDAKAGVAQCHVGGGHWQPTTDRNMKWVSCASAGQVWGVDAAGKACVLGPAPVQPSSNAADLLTVAGRTGPLWTETFSANAIAWTDSAGKTGTIPLPGSLPAMLAATDPAQPGAHPLWATLVDYAVQPPMKTMFWDGSAWKDSGGPGFNAVAIGVDNSVWGYVGQAATAAATDLYRFNAQGQWVLAVKSPSAVAMQFYVVIDAYDIWGMDVGSTLYHWNGQSWTPQPAGSPYWIRRGWDGALYGMSQSQGRTLLRFNGFTQWVPMPVSIYSFSDIAVRDGSGFWWAQRQSPAPSLVQFWPGTTWQDMGGQLLATISGAADGTVWGTDANNAILRYNGTTWDSMPGQAKQVSVGRSDLVWSVDVNGNAQRWTGSGWEAHGNPGAALNCIAALGDGTVFGAAVVQQKTAGQPVTEGEVFLWDGAKWQATGFLADQIAGTDSDHLAGVTRGPNGTGGSLVLGNPIQHFQPADLQNVGFAPPNPVYAGTTMTLSWGSYPGAVAYEARINAAAGNIEQKVTGTSLSYTLQSGDIFRSMGGWVHALDNTGNIVAQGTANYYCGNNAG